MYEEMHRMIDGEDESDEENIINQLEKKMVGDQKDQEEPVDPNPPAKSEENAALDSLLDDIMDGL